LLVKIRLFESPHPSLSGRRGEMPTMKYDEYKITRNQIVDIKNDLGLGLSVPVLSGLSNLKFHRLITSIGGISGIV
jgi:hypothetical protein